MYGSEIPGTPCPTGTEGAKCFCDQLITVGETPPEKGTNQDWWEFWEDFALRNGSLIITLHFDPPIKIRKNQKHWLEITPQMETNSKYVIVWLQSANFNGNVIRFFNEDEERWETATVTTERDMEFILTGKKQVVGCGPCQLYGDVFPFDPANPNQDPDGANVGNCLVDIDDLLVILGAFALSPNATKSTGGPYPDDVDLFPCGGAGGIVDIDDVVALLEAFAGTYACPHLCNPGACCGILTDNDGNPASCLDWDQQPPEQTPSGGMSQSTCHALGGVFVEDAFPSTAVCLGDGNANGIDDVCPGG